MYPRNIWCRNVYNIYMQDIIVNILMAVFVVGMISWFLYELSYKLEKYKTKLLAFYISLLLTYKLNINNIDNTEKQQNTDANTENN